MTWVILERHERDLSAREASAAARALLEKHLKEKYALGMEELRMSKSSDGKPYFENCFVKFNISHSGKYVALALSELEVGVDVQTVKSISQRVARRYLESDENDADRLTRLWTEYESVGKCEGCGIPHKLDRKAYHLFLKKLDSAWLCVCLPREEEIKLIIEP